MQRAGLQQAYSISLVSIDALRPHEDVVEDHVKKIAEDLRRRSRLLYPVLVDAKTMVILDGHHRVAALRQLGAKYVPAVLVEYDSPCVEVGSWRPNISVNKSLVVRAGLEKKLLPPKTSRHRVCFKIPRVDIPLKVLPS
ncbi:MAG TPA: transcriptional regulator [Pyrodictium sp.]|nr:transcriptional regulator [Pyrodictium sp.]